MGLEPTIALSARVPYPLGQLVIRRQPVAILFDQGCILSTSVTVLLMGRFTQSSNHLLISDFHCRTSILSYMSLQLEAMFELTTVLKLSANYKFFCCLSTVISRITFIIQVGIQPNATRKAYPQISLTLLCWRGSLSTLAFNFKLCKYIPTARGAMQIFMSPTWDNSCLTNYYIVGYVTRYNK